jgi:uncharacterized protein
MINKLYGKTEKRISALGFGGLRFTNERDGVEAVQKALELGINYFDTAPNYSNSRSENIIGQGLRGFNGKAFVATKSMVPMDPKADQVLRRIDTSLKRLGVDKIDFFHIWNIIDWSQFEQAVKKGGTYDGALKAKELGLIDHIAFSSHAGSDDIIRIVNTGLFEGVTLSYNIINHPYRWSAVQAANRAGMGVATMNSLHGGLIPLAADKLSPLKQKSDRSVIIAALGFNISHPEVTVALSGMKNPKEVIANVEAVSEAAGSPQDPETLREMYVSQNGVFCTMCGYCLPCSREINLPLYMSIHDMRALGLGKMARHNYAINRMKNAFGSARASDCVECGECQERCTQHLDIPARLRSVGELDLPDYKIRLMKIVNSIMFAFERQPLIRKICSLPLRAFRKR